MIILDYRNRRPLYEQIAEKFRILILRGVLLPESRMPSVRQLAMDLSINPNTIQRAYMELEQEGMIYPVKGKGNFVSDVEQLRKKSRDEYCGRFRSVVCEGIALGMREEELTEIVKACYKEGKV